MLADVLPLPLCYRSAKYNSLFIAGLASASNYVTLYIQAGDADTRIERLLLRRKIEA